LPDIKTYALYIGLINGFLYLLSIILASYVFAKSSKYN
jgi:hypothetical protein